jgi:hypothetical protein
MAEQVPDYESADEEPKVPLPRGVGNASNP